MIERTSTVPAEARGLEIVAGDLPAIDAIDAELLVFVCASIRREPRGVLGRLDWREGGRIARLVRDGRFRGAAGERVLTTLRGGRALLLAGLGDEGATDLAALARAIEATGRRSVVVGIHGELEPVALFRDLLPKLSGRTVSALVEPADLARVRAAIA